MFSNSCLPKFGWIAALALFLSSSLAAQQQPSPDRLAKILDRLDQLEKQNQELLSEIKALREELQNANAPANQQLQSVEEKVDVAGQRIDEQAQTKVESSQKFPLTVTGMFLFDSFFAKGSDSPIFQNLYGQEILGGPGGGATLQQSIIGLEFRGPEVFAGAHINGFLSMDFYGQQGSGDLFRIRRGVVSFDWKNRSIIFGQDKSIISPLQPTSFARVAVPPLSGAGNLWLWRPQITYEERLPISARTKATFQGSVLETDESYTAPASSGGYYSEYNRPAVQARVQLEHDRGEESKFAVGVAGSGSTSHILGQSIPSRVISVDLRVKPWYWFELSGTLLTGKNFANLGGVPQGVTIGTNGTVVPIRGTAGWLQAAFPVTKRLTFDVYAGRQVNDDRDLSAFEVSRSQTSAANVLYRIGPNVVLGFEAARNRVEYLNALTFWTDRYDATLGYLF